MNQKKPLITTLVSAVFVILAAAMIFRISQDRQTPRETEEVRVAVAANFTDVVKILAQCFEAETGDKVSLNSGSTGALYAQIKNGAPFDIFLAADAARPTRLEAEGAAVMGSRFTYAVGKLVLWSPNPNLVDSQGQVLERGDFERLAMANPELAPYGAAAREVLEARGLWNRLQEKIVRGENISQTFHFVDSGNAQLGFVACSQVKRPDQTAEGSYWKIPDSLYTPIEQQAVLLEEKAAARAFLDFIRGNEALDIVRRYGYGVP